MPDTIDGSETADHAHDMPSDDEILRTIVEYFTQQGQGCGQPERYLQDVRRRLVDFAQGARQPRDRHAIREALAHVITVRRMLAEMAEMGVELRRTAQPADQAE